MAICISDSAPSIIRAPPLHDTITTGIRRSTATSIPRTSFSPMTTPMLPPMKPYSIAAAITGSPSIVPAPTMSASLSPVALRLEARRAAYGLVSVKVSGSLEARAASCSTHCSSSNSVRSRSAAVSRK